MSAEGGSFANLYIESSAILALLFGEAGGVGVGRILGAADFLVTSELTLVECDRAIQRGLAQGAFLEGQAADLHHDVASLSQDWNILRLTPAIMGRARGSFPGEPIRTLDALHVASALEASMLVAAPVLLTLDSRIRKVAAGLGFSVAPA